MGNTFRPVRSAAGSATSMQPSLAPTQATSPTQSANGLPISPVSPTASPRSHSPTMSPRSRSNEPTHLPSTFPATAQSATTPIALSHPTGVHTDSEPSNKLQNLQTGGNLDSYIFRTPQACKITSSRDTSDRPDSRPVVPLVAQCRPLRHRPDSHHAGFPARFRASQHPARLPRCPTCRQRRPHRPSRGRARSPSSAPGLRPRRPPVALRLAPRRPRTAAVRLLLVTTPASSPQVSPPQPVFLLWR